MRLREVIFPRGRVSFIVPLTLMAATTLSVHATTYYLAVDVPSNLGGIDYTTSHLIRSDNAIYVLQQVLPAGTEISALDRRPDGVWQLSPAHPLMLGATTYEARDIVTYNGATFAVVVDGSTVGIPEYARIDAIFHDPLGGVVISFDVPVNLGGMEYSRSDLVRLAAGFSLYWDAEAAGVPLNANVVGADLDSAGELVITLDVPTRLGGSDFLPGQLVRWNGAAFSNYFADGSWPASSQLRDFSFVPGAGTVPDGNGAGEVPLTVTSAGGGSITLTWGTSCLSSDTDYAVYEGLIGNYYSHVPKFCTTVGAPTKTFVPASSSSYYLVVPGNALSEGSFGLRSSGAERPPGVANCLPQVISTTCHE